MEEPRVVKYTSDPSIWEVKARIRRSLRPSYIQAQKKKEINFPTGKRGWERERASQQYVHGARHGMETVILTV